LEHINAQVEPCIHKPVVEHLQPVDLHVLNQPHFFFKHNFVQEHWHADRKQQRVYCVSDAIDDLLQLFVDLWFEGEELDPCYDMGVIEERANIRLVHFVLKVQSSLNRFYNVRGISKIQIRIIVVEFFEDNAYFSYSVVSVVLVVFVVIDLELIVELLWV
jgi:hypothetical protein